MKRINYQLKRNAVNINVPRPNRINDITHSGYTSNKIHPFYMEVGHLQGFYCSHCMSSAITNEECTLHQCFFFPQKCNRNIIVGLL